MLAGGTHPVLLIPQPALLGGRSRVVKPKTAVGDVAAVHVGSGAVEAVHVQPVIPRHGSIASRTV